MVRRAPWIVVACIVAVSAGCGRRAPQPETVRQEQIVPVGAIVAQTAGIRAVIRASGVVVASEGAEFLVRPPEPARIVEIRKAVGDPVSSNDVLVRFDLPSATQDVARLTAELAGAQAQLENARINQTRMREFVEKGFVPRRDLDTADRELADAQAAVTRARSAHATAEAAAARAVVRAPFDGIVVAPGSMPPDESGRGRVGLFGPGDFVSSTSAPVMRIVDPRRLEIVAQVPETEIARVVPGASARIAGASETDPVKLTVFGRPPDRSAAETLPVRLVFVQPPAIAVDTRVEVDIDAEERTDTILLPAEAILREGTLSVVYVANGSTAERRVVTLGITDDSRVEIRTGVKPGELVINRGHVGLTDGATISVDVGR